ncbi:MAG: sulfurtransferase [candidate division NC10 bacterium]|nr:sulfurtransferase [candidate division NC10 bacterium]
MKQVSRVLVFIPIVCLALVGALWAGGYANPQLLIETQELAARLNDPDLRIVDLRSEEEYQQGHIPGAVHGNPRSLDDLEANKQGLPLPAENAGAIFGGLGIDERTRVVAYDNMGGLFAARLFYVLEFFGHKNVQILNGGMDKWIREGRPQTTEVPKVPMKSFVAKENPDVIATAEWVKANLGSPKVCLVDARSPKEYSGEDLQSNKRGGHIPGAVNIDWVETIDPTTKVFKLAEDLRKLFEASGATKGREIVTYCQSGYRAAHSYFVARLLGYEKVRNYDGSWQEWGNDPALPLER